MLAAAGTSNADAARLDKAFWGPTEVDGKSQFPIYKDLGVTIYQMAAFWSSVAPTPPADPRDPNDPAYDWPENVDYAIAQAKQHHMKVLIMLIGAPEWANGGNTGSTRPTGRAISRRLRGRPRGATRACATG